MVRPRPSITAIGRVTKAAGSKFLILDVNGKHFCPISGRMACRPSLPCPSSIEVLGRASRELGVAPSSAWEMTMVVPASLLRVLFLRGSEMVPWVGRLAYQIPLHREKE
jgi:hypothetical protein